MKNQIQLVTLAGTVLMLASCGAELPVSAQPSVTAAMVTSKQSASQQVSVSDYHDVVQKIYVGYFGRPADPAGLAFFANRLLVLNAPTTVKGISEAYRTNPDIRQVVDVFGTSQESADLYPGDNSVFMDAVYSNLFGRAADVDGKAFWVNAINLGLVTRADAAVSVMAGAQGADITVVDKKATVAAFFTSSLTTSTQKAAYDGLAANVFARSMLSGVALATDTTAYQANVATTVSSLVANLPPAGLYFGKLGGGALYQAMVLENGQYWAMNSQGTTGHFTPVGVLQGVISVNNGQFTSSDIRFLNPQPYAAYSYNGSLVPQTSMSGTLTLGSDSIPLANAPAPTTYDFNQPAKSADIEGNWTMRDVENAQASVNVGGNAITGTAGNCDFTGTLTPRASGKNVFDAAITYGAFKSGACRLANQTVNGIAYSYVTDEGATRQFFIAMANASRSTGNMLQGIKVLPDGIAPAFSTSDIVVGTGTPVSNGKIVTVHYTGWLYNATSPGLRSTKFDSSVDRGTPFEFVLGTGNVIQGWHQGVAGMRVGGKRTLILPANLGYGASGAGTFIAPNASLVFDVEVLGVR